MSKATIAVTAHMEKADRALTSARTLLAANDGDGACNRAYYAMFDAAHAALLAMAPDAVETGIKTHSRLVGVFGERIIQPKLLTNEFGRALNKVQHFREVADYSGDPVSHEDAAWAVEQAEAFVGIPGIPSIPHSGDSALNRRCIPAQPSYRNKCTVTVTLSP